MLQSYQKYSAFTSLLGRLTKCIVFERIQVSENTDVVYLIEENLFIIRKKLFFPGYEIRVTMREDGGKIIEAEDFLIKVLRDKSDWCHINLDPLCYRDCLEDKIFKEVKKLSDGTYYVNFNKELTFDFDDVDSEVLKYFDVSVSVPKNQSEQETSSETQQDEETSLEED